MMDLGLHDKIALVTAASKGLGKAVALRLGQEGAHIALCARTRDHLATTAAEIEAATHQPPLTSPASACSWMGECIEG